MTITYRNVKGTALTYDEMDGNIQDLYQNTTIDRVLGNGNTTTKSLTIGSITSTGNITTASLTTTGDISTTGTTINFATTATTLNIGASTGTTTINNNLNTNSLITIATASVGTNLNVTNSIGLGTTASGTTGVISYPVRPYFNVLGFQFQEQNGIITPMNKQSVAWFNATTNTWIVTTGVNYIFVKMWGAGGGGGLYGGWRQGSLGGSGGFSHGIVPVVPGTTITIKPGERGLTPDNNPHYSFPDGGSSATSNGDARYASGGGGSSSIIVPSISSSPCMYAGGGGGGGSISGYSLNNGGPGGGLVGGTAALNLYTTGFGGSGPAGQGGTQSSGGTAGTGNSANNGQAGSLGQGGTFQNGNPYGGGGGGGYYGGGSGAYTNGNSMGGGGGGSGYLHPSLIMAATYTGSARQPAFFFDPDLTQDGLYWYGHGGDEACYGGNGVIVFYY